MSDSVHTWDAALHALAERVRRGGGLSTRVQGPKGGARPFFLFRHLSEHPRPCLAVLADTKQAERFVSDLRFFFGESDAAPPFERRIHLLPGWDVPPFEDVSPVAEVVAARIEGLYHLRQSRNPIIVTTADAVLQRLPPRATFASRYRYLVEGEEIDRDELAVQLDAWGYRRVDLVEDRGEYAVRGGIVDVFPPAHPNPMRIELLGDAIETLHEFDRVGQRPIERRQDLLVLPVRELDWRRVRERDVVRTVEARALDLDVARDERNAMIGALNDGTPFPGIEFLLPYTYESLDTIADYLPPETILWIDGPANVDAALERAEALVARRAGERNAEHRFLPPPETLFQSPAAWRASLARHPVVEVEPLEMLAAGEDERRITARSFTLGDLKVQRSHARHELSFAPIAERVKQWADDGQQVLIVVGGDAQAERVARLLEVNGVAAERSAEPVATLLARRSAQPRVVIGALGEGFRVPSIDLVAITEADVFGETRRRAARRVSVAQLLRNLSELKTNDFVVHLDHGVGLYRGLRHLRVADTEGDYLHLEYAGGDRLYVPVDRISVVQKYAGADGATPTVDKLGGASWDKVKQKTRESILAMAKELLAVYAAREVHDRPSVQALDTYYREFEAAFPFEETPDQKQAIDDVLSDLQRAKPMDRLICGDVGYGKTEVAMRGAFLAVMEGRQVAVLVPTTILAQQHTENFRRRFQGYPVRIESLSRFLTAGQVQGVLRGLKEGSVDVVIGTHRLLQTDVEFKRLGLLVIDEEHRFGVRHKERIKAMRKLVDVMAMTATPIPRTLQMSLMGIRDLSVIETPPVDRLAVRTYVTRYDDDIVRDAIRRELERGGQVFFVHNRVENIDVMARHLQRLVPEAKIVVAHGQMHERDLEKVMLSFLERQANVLVSSAIIESGLDIPNANTILINRADHFGLAQLYQLRGRVGRSHERAFAYLMIPGEHIISRDAQERLKVLQELDDLGGGFRLAAHDLEIRGAGNLLGKQQSGQIAAVGFELYTQMMEEAVQELRGERVRVDVEPEIQLGFPAYIPDSYVSDERQRLAFYRRLAAAENRAELDDLALEMRERYGPVPPLVDSFLRVMDLRRRLKNAMVVRARQSGDTVSLQFHPEAPVDVEQLVLLVERSRGRLRLSADFQISFTVESSDWDGLVAEIEALLERLHALPRSGNKAAVEETDARAVR